jgi:hypothetical protein
MTFAKRFPAAIRAVNSLERAHVACPEMVAEFASLVEGSLQSYGRCLLGKNSGDVQRAVEMHLARREQARKCLHAILQSSGQSKCINSANRELDCLYASIDTVMTAMSIQCPALVSNIRL